MAITQYRIINVSKGVLAITTSNLFKVDTPVSSALVYRAILNQASTNAPTVNVLENSTGLSIVWTRNGVGTYQVVLTGNQVGKIYMNIPLITNSGNTFFSMQIILDGKSGDTNLFIKTFTGFPSALALADDLLSDNPVEIIYYP